MWIIPAIDIIDGKCVRLTRGDYTAKKEYSDDPVAVAIAFEEAGLSRLHLVDLDGASARKVINIEVLQQICAATELKVDFGGGVQSDEDIERVFEAGAHQVTAGSIAVKDPQIVERWIGHWGAERIILGADVMGDKVMTGAWKDTSDLTWTAFINHHVQMGLLHVISTDVDKDGMLEGPSLDLYRRMQAQFPTINLIASGGISSFRDLQELESLGLHGAIVGKAYYEGHLSLEQLSAMNNRKTDAD